MMTRDPRGRPSVSKLLELPSVKRAVSARARKVWLKRLRDLVLCILVTLVAVLSFLVDLASSVLKPVTWMLPKVMIVMTMKSMVMMLPQAKAPLPATPPPPMSPISPQSFFHQIDRYPDGFSDDESERDTTGSSLAAPLDMDTSPSLRHSHSSPASSFFSPRAASLDNSYTGSPVRRRPAATAGSRARVSARTRAMARTPGGMSPGDIYILY